MRPSFSFERQYAPWKRWLVGFFCFFFAFAILAAISGAMQLFKEQAKIELTKPKK